MPSGKYHYVKCAGLHGTYDDGLEWLKRTKTSAKTTCVLSLGSSIGNFSREEAAKFLHQFSRMLRPQDSLLIGLDSCQDSQRIFQAYNDSEGVTEAFYRNGLTHANRLLGYEGFKQSQWAVVGSYDAQLCCHNAHYAALDNISINGIQIEKGSSIHLEKACKYSGQQMKDLWHASGLLHQAAFGNERADYSRSRSLKHDKYCRVFHSSIVCTQRQVVKTESSRIRQQWNLCVLFSFRTIISVTEDLRLFSNMVSPRTFCVSMLIPHSLLPQIFTSSHLLQQLIRPSRNNMLHAQFLRSETGKSFGLHGTW